MRRAMTCVYWEPKSRMTICSFISKMKRECLPSRENFGEENRSQTAIPHSREPSTSSVAKPYHTRTVRSHTARPPTEFHCRDWMDTFPVMLPGIARRYHPRAGGNGPIHAEY